MVTPRLQIQKISQMWWCTPVIPATLEAEAGESFEPGRQRLQLIEIVPLYSSLGDRVRLLKTTTKVNSKVIVPPHMIQLPCMQLKTLQSLPQKSVKSLSDVYSSLDSP